MATGADIIKYSHFISSALSGEDIIFASEFDLSPDGKFTEGFFAMSKTRLCIIENGSVKSIEKISTIKKAHCTQYTGGGIVEVFFEDHRRQLLRFSMKYIEDFCAVCEIINDIKQGNDVNLKQYKKEEALCPNCHRPFIRDTAICPDCSDKMGVIKRIWDIAKSCKGLYMLLLLLFWVTSAVTIINPMLSKWLVNDVLNEKNASLEKLVTIVSLMVLCALIEVAVTILRNVVSTKASNHLVMELRNHIY